MVAPRETQQRGWVPSPSRFPPSGFFSSVVGPHCFPPRCARTSPPSPPHSRYPSVVAVSLFSGMLPPLVGLPHHTGKWGNKLPTARRDFFGDLGPDRVCVSLGHTQTAAGGTRWKFTWAWIDTGIRAVSSVYIGLFCHKNLAIFFIHLVFSFKFWIVKMRFVSFYFLIIIFDTGKYGVEEFAYNFALDNYDVYKDVRGIGRYSSIDND